MKTNPKIYRMLSIFCWIGTVIATFLMGYMIHLTHEFPNVETFERNVRIAGVLLLLWLCVSAFFTMLAIKENRKK